MFSADSDGILIYTRADRDDNPENDVYHDRTIPPSVIGRYSEYTKIDNNPLLVEGTYGIGVENIVNVIKTAPRMNHGFPSAIKNTIGWESMGGIDVQYVGEYEIAQPFIVGPSPRTDRPSSLQSNINNLTIGININLNTFGVVINNPYVANTARGIRVSNHIIDPVYTPTKEDLGNYVINPKFYNVGQENYENNAIVTTRPNPLSVAGWVKIDKVSPLVRFGSSTKITGKVSDTLGAEENWPRYSFFKNENQDCTITEIAGLLSISKGYYVDTDTGLKFVITDRGVRIRPTSKVYTIKVPVPFDDKVFERAQLLLHSTVKPEDLKPLGNVSINSIHPFETIFN